MPHGVPAAGKAVATPLPCRGKATGRRALLGNGAGVGSVLRLGFKSKKTNRGKGYYLSTIDYEEQKRERNALSVDDDEMPF